MDSDLEEQLKLYDNLIDRARFERKPKLKRLMIVHTGDKRHVCSVCEHAVLRPHDLTDHKRTHTGEKSHVCAVYGRGFAQPGKLARNRTLHTGQRYFFCLFVIVASFNATTYHRT
jgi:KRAB domain-containing zinc finger protein